MKHKLTLCIAILLLSVIVVRPCPAQSGTATQAPQNETITIDAQAPAQPFPHFWERMFGSGRAILSLRESYRRDLKSVKQAAGFDYIRFHAIFHDEVGLYSEDAQGQPVYNFSYVDQIYDGLLENGVRPFIELSFMPQQLAAKPSLQAFWYHPNNAPPKDWTRWGNMIEAFTRHLVSRYGIEEVASWYFEVWNEPNIDFWAGEPKESTYYQLYDETAKAIKRVSPRLRVGGPSTAQAAWADRFIKHCADGDIPVDFVSTHVYGNDTAHDVLGSNEAIGRDKMVIRAVQKVHDQVKASAKPGLPIIFSEYNAAYDNEVPVTDSAYMGPWLGYTISHCAGLVDIMSYWSFSDVFEEQGVVKKPFYGGFGLLAAGNIPKAAFNDFKILHELGDERLPVNSDSALATRRHDGSLEIAVWNYAPPEAAGSSKQVTLSFEGLPRQRHVRVQWVDDQRGSSLAAWKAMGEPAFPSREQQRQLRAAGQLPAAESRTLSAGQSPTLNLTLGPHALAVVEISK
ncbi:MAG TPA: cellulase family glycosylhydrolase [Terriglobia bacterium]|nr:cellulase family glycosylhydrolase [Terriglobia bacterium]